MRRSRGVNEPDSEGDESNGERKSAAFDEDEENERKEESDESDDY